MKFSFIGLSCVGLSYPNAVMKEFADIVGGYIKETIRGVRVEQIFIWQIFFGIFNC